MKKLGISIYPESMDKKKVMDYIKLAHKYGFSKIFTCLLSPDLSQIDKIKEKYQEINKLALELGFEVALDVNPKVFEDLNISYNDLTFFKELNATTIRLDGGFSGNEEALMTFNPHNLYIEINMSANNLMLDNIMSYQPTTDYLIGCHNFYPKRYTGLTYEIFNKCNQKFKKHNLKISAFVNSQNATLGPWPINEGLCTIEAHRNLPIEVQAQELWNLGIDDVIIANCFASEKELKVLSQIDKRLFTLKMDTNYNLTEVEKTIAYDYLHFVRGDVSDYMLRSSISRVKHKDDYIKPNNVLEQIKKYDVLIPNSDQKAHYKGEFIIAKNDFKNDGLINVIGSINKDYRNMVDLLNPWQKFKVIAS